VKTIKRQLKSLLDTYNLAQIIDFPTRIGPTSASLIDNFFLDRNVYNNFQAHSVINEDWVEVFSQENANRKFNSFHNTFFF
jgi:hypothetical protein